MLNMSDTSQEFLENNCPELLAIDDLNTFLIELDSFILLNCFDRNEDITELGRKAEAVYDEVYCCNE